MSSSVPLATQLALSVATVIFTSYAAGRVHQWYRQGYDRDIAFREGYNQASHSLFQLAVRSQPVAAIEAEAPEPHAIRAVVPVYSLPGTIDAESVEKTRAMRHHN